MSKQRSAIDDIDDDDAITDKRKSGYTWDNPSWDLLEEEVDEVELQKSIHLAEQRRTRQRITEHNIPTIIRKGIIRFTYLIIDLSVNIQKKLHQLSRDSVLSTSTTTSMSSLMKQHSTRHALVLDTAIDFVKEYFDQNVSACHNINSASHWVN